MDLKGKKVALIVASNGYQSIEYGIPKKILESEGIEVVTVSNKPGGAVASDETTTLVDIPLDQLNPVDYDGIFFIGGPGAMEHLDIPLSYKIISEAKKEKIPYGAICIAPRILAKAYGLEGKKATCWNDDNAAETIFKSFQVTPTLDADIVTDGLVVTASGPQAANEFAEGILRVLRKKKLGE